jgi:integrase
MGRKRLAKNRALPPNLYENSAGYLYYIHPHSKQSKGLGRDRPKAIIEARAANAALATMRPSSLVDWATGKQDYTLAEWVPLYKAMWIEKTDPAPNTLRNASSYLSRIEAASIAWMRLPEIGTAHAASFLAETEKESGAAAALAMRARLRDLFRMAETQGLIEAGKNPVVATYTPSRVVKRERLTLEQFRAVHALAPKWLQRAMMLALVTAQRRDDIANMKFTDQKDGYLYIVQGKSQGEIKLQQDINIRLQAVGPSIGEVIADCRDLIVSRYMIHHIAHRGTARPGDQIASNGISNAFQEAVIAAGIEASEGRTAPTFHEIRSLSERLYKAEFGAEFAQAMLGHKNASMTAKYDDMRGKGYQVIAAKA